MSGNKACGIERIRHAFTNGKAFIGFLTGGDPNLSDSEERILALARGGADIIEIGVPFSDPIAEGPVIQAANIRALSAGVTVPDIFNLSGKLRRQIQTPLVLLTYLNPVFHYGYGRFFEKCVETGVDGVVIPDMPFEEQGEAKSIARENGVALISLVAPTSEERIERIAKDADGFLYIVSSMGVTGVRGEITSDLKSMIASVRAVSDIPAAVGFGVGTPGQAREITAEADGVIIGSAIVRLAAQHGENAPAAIEAYARGIKAAIGG